MFNYKSVAASALLCAAVTAVGTPSKTLTVDMNVDQSYGATGVSGLTNGPPAVSRFNQPFGVAGDDHPLAVGARRRRDVWDDREEVLASYGSRPPLDALDPEALAGYVRWGFRDSDDGRIELACRPETEANIFGRTRSHGPLEAFEALRRVTCPVAVMAGARTDLDPGWFVDQAAAVGVDLQVLDGGHFVLFEDTEQAVDLVDRNLRTLGILL